MEDRITRPDCRREAEEAMKPGAFSGNAGFEWAGFGDWILGVLSFQGFGEGEHHPAQVFRTFGSKVALFEGIRGEVEELVRAVVGLRPRKVVVNNLPIVLAVGREMAAPMRRVGIVHQEGFAARRVSSPGKKCLERGTVQRMRGGCRNAGGFEEGREDVVNGRLLALDGACGNRNLALERVAGFRARPSGDEWDPHAALVVGSFASPEWFGAGNGVFVSMRGIGPVVAEKEDEGVAGDLQGFEVVDQVAEGFVHALDERGKGLGRSGPAGILVVRGKARVALEGRVDRVVGKVKEERFVVLHSLGDMGLGFRSQGVGQKCVRAMVFLESGNGMGGSLFAGAIEIVLPEITGGMAVAGSGDIDVEAEVDGVGAWGSFGAEMAFAHMDRAVARLLEESREGDRFGAEPEPVPVWGRVFAAVILVGVDPVGGVVARGVLSGEQGDPGGGADAHGAELVEPDALSRQSLHLGSPVELVERVSPGFALGIGQERHGGIHDAHVVHEENHEVGSGLGCEEWERGERAHQADEKSEEFHGREPGMGVPFQRLEKRGVAETWGKRSGAWTAGF